MAGTAGPRVRFHGDLIAASLDNDPPRELPPGDRSAYVVCSTPRSGSGLLCRALAATGSAAVPMEYFNGALAPALAQRWGCPVEPDPYRDALWARRADGHGLLGVKLHWRQLLDVVGEPRPESLAQLLGVMPRCVRIRRADLARQAVSLWTALQTGVWSVGSAQAGEEPDVGYDFAGIERCRAEIEAGDAGWDELIAVAGLEVTEVTYEELVARFELTIRRVVAFVAPDAGEVSVAPPATARQGGARAQALLDRYLADLAS